MEHKRGKKNKSSGTKLQGLMDVCAVSHIKEREKVIAYKACNQVYACVCIYLYLSPF